MPGNQGLLDQNMALKFVKSNIAAFGGNPDDITLMGQSAGSSSTLYHFMSPRSAGLFQKVIAQSGSNFSPSLHSVTSSQVRKIDKIVYKELCLTIRPKLYLLLNDLYRQHITEMLQRTQWVVYSVA